ncbi:MAG TPA: hypothetical protein VIM10_16190 [Actinopolymorphaceae bacterium]|jgi:hypothetical protein
MGRTTLHEQLCALVASSQSRWIELNSRRERGDVPGWVLVTLMTALLVGALYVIAGPRLAALLNQALSGF